MSEPLLRAENVSKTYVMGDQEIRVLSHLSLAIEPGEIVAVVGASGVGKSTLLHILGLLDTPDEGTVYHRGEDLNRLPAAKRAERRNRVMGFVFQFYHLIPELSALENTMLPAMMYRGHLRWRREKRALRERALGILADLGLSARLKHRPSQLSGGERQRVAIARALMNEPEILLCDEPTGNLDPKTSVGVQEALWGLKGTFGPAMLLVTHDVAIARRADRVLRMEDGALVPLDLANAPAPAD